MSARTQRNAVVWVDTMQSGINFMTFRRNVLPLLSWRWRQHFPAERY